MSIRGISTRVVASAHAATTRLLRRLTPEVHPRPWSNSVIRPIAGSVTGDVIHVSAWKDEDKEGGFYRDYFSKAASYTTTNVGGERGEVEHADLALDLSVSIAPEMERSFDFVFNHTTLEHVSPIGTAINNLFALSRSEVLIVVPFMQVEHWEAPSFGDYWRVCRHGLAKACIDNDFEVLTLTSNHNPVWPIYHCLHARRVEEIGVIPDVWEATGTAKGFGSRLVSPGNPLMS